MNFFFHIKARALAEEHASTLMRQRVIEEKKMKELEKIKDQLEVCLEEEKQAKKDEEIVRQLQARVLEEEWGRRDQLEKLQVIIIIPKKLKKLIFFFLRSFKTNSSCKKSYSPLNF